MKSQRNEAEQPEQEIKIMNRTPIEWTHWSVNPFKMRMPDGTLINVCVHKSEGCRFCYAEGIVRRWWKKEWGEFPGYAAALLKIGAPELVEEELLAVLRLNERIKLGKSDPHINRVFWNDMTDEYLEFWPDDFIDKLWAIRALTPNLVHQVLTKRADRLHHYFKNRFTRHYAAKQAAIFTGRYDGATGTCDSTICNAEFPYPNVHLGVSVEDQKTADERIPLLLQTPAVVRWISAEPLLGPVDLKDFMWPLRWRWAAGYNSPEEALAAGAYAEQKRQALVHADCRFVDWVVCGGESGPKARPMHPDWARSLRDRCVVAGVPFFFKQWGEWKECGHDEDGPHIEEIEYPSELAEAYEPLIDGFLSADGHFVKKPKQFTPDVHYRALERPGKKAAGRLLDGVEWNQYPRAGNEEAIRATAGTL